jgi:hypothetical protein
MQRGSLKAVLHRGVKVWCLQWRENGRGRTRILGRCMDMSRDEADAERKRILAPLNDTVYHERRHTSGASSNVPLPDFQVQRGIWGVAGKREA